MNGRDLSHVGQRRRTPAPSTGGAMRNNRPPLALGRFVVLALAAWAAIALLCWLLWPR